MQISGSTLTAFVPRRTHSQAGVTLRTTFLLLVLFPLLVANALSAQPGTRVNFKFAWKPGTVAEVRSVTGMSGMNPSAPGDTSATVIRSTRRMSVDRHPQGLAVRNEPVSVGSEPSTVAAGTAAAVIGAQGAFTLLVSPAGQFVGLGDTAQMKKSLDSAIAATPNIGMLSPAARASLERSTGMASMTAVMRAGWEQQTAGFLGRSWTVGEEVTMTVEMPLPMMAPGQTLNSTQRLTLVAIAPCDSTVPAVRCALVKRTSVVDPASMRRSMLEMFKNAGMDTSNPDMLAMIPETSAEIEVDGLMEIETLLPRRLNQRIVQNTVMMGMSRRTEVTTVTAYHYTSR
jgi:hypothetical protein